MFKGKSTKSNPPIIVANEYNKFYSSVASLLDAARLTSARSVNQILTATYWQIGKRIVKFEQKGSYRAEYGKSLIKKLSADLSIRYGRGFSERNLEQMRLFYSEWKIPQTVSAESFKGDVYFPLPWSHYVHLMAIKDKSARMFYEQEALKGGWSIRQLDRQTDSKFYERVMLSKNKTKLLKSKTTTPKEELLPEEAIKAPFILEFLGLRDEYSESDLEEALIKKLEHFLLELGNDFTFVGRQKRLRVGDAWYRIDLLFFHRRLRCMVVIDLKLGKFTHADAGQMHLYLNYVREHWTNPDENPPVGLILCAQKDTAVAHYALEGLPNKILAAEYRMTLPDEKTLVEEIKRTQKLIALKKG